MDNLSFETLSQGWNAIRMSGAPNLRKLIPGLVDPSRIIMQRADETPETLTVAFKGFEQALNDTEQEGPILKRAILAWVKNFAEAQIARSGDPQSFIIRIVKPQPQSQVAENKKWQEITEALEAGAPRRKLTRASLAKITEVRKTDGW